MTGTTWGLIALGGIGIVAIGNILRARRTDDRGCMGEFFVSADRMTVVEHAMNRAGIATFVTGILLAVVL